MDRIRLVEQLSPVHFFLRTYTNSRVKFAVHVNRMKPFVDPNERPINPPQEEVDEPYLDESDIPVESFDHNMNNNQELRDQIVVDEVSDGSVSSQPTGAEAQGNNQSDGSDIVDNVNIFAAEKILKKRVLRGKVFYLIK